jgi:hypothetical protein
MGFCDLILKEGGRELPIKTWMEMLEKQIPSATEYFPPAIGHHADDTWEHVRCLQNIYQFATIVILEK